jgi:hypothetical protein
MQSKGRQETISRSVLFYGTKKWFPAAELGVWAAPVAVVVESGRRRCDMLHQSGQLIMVLAAELAGAVLDLRVDDDV